MSKEEIVCELCNNTGEVPADELDKDSGEYMPGVGTQICLCQSGDEFDMSGATEGDR